MTQVNPSERRSYAGETAEERATRRRVALIDAAFALVADHGWRAVKIDAVCRHAALNKRYFYESFTGIDGLTEAVIERLAADAIEAALGALDPHAPREEATRTAVATLIAHLTDDPRRARVLFGAVPAGDAAAVHRDAAIRRLVATLAARGRDLYALAEDPAIDLAAAMMVGGTGQAVIDWFDGRVDCSRDALVDDLVALWHVVGDGATELVRTRAR